jgi:dTDP-D-glucose 4,6-dehydratase
MEKNRCILVTGGLGFIGSNFIRDLFQEQSDIKLINIDKNTYASQKWVDLYDDFFALGARKKVQYKFYPYDIGKVRKISY